MVVDAALQAAGLVVGADLEPVLHQQDLRIHHDLRRWAGEKYLKLRTHKAFQAWWTGLIERQPRLFAHWQWAHGWH